MVSEEVIAKWKAEGRTDLLERFGIKVDESIREDFNPMDLAEGLQKRKELYESIHPETKKGQAQALATNIKLGRQVGISPHDTFVEDTSRKMGKSETFVKKKESWETKYCKKHLYLETSLLEKINFQEGRMSRKINEILKDYVRRQEKKEKRDEL